MEIHPLVGELVFSQEIPVPSPDQVTPLLRQAYVSLTQVKEFVNWAHQGGDDLELDTVHDLLLDSIVGVTKAHKVLQRRYHVPEQTNTPAVIG